MTNTTVQMSINGAAVETNVVLTAVANDNIDFTDGTLRIGNRAGTVYFEGLLGQIYLTQEYLDISSSSNRQKFYNDGVVDFSSNGSTPTGNQPRIYLNNPADSISINHGSGGNFTPNGGGGGVFVDGGYINDSIYSSSNDSFANSYELIQRFGKNNVNFPNGFTVGDHKKAGQCITLPACSISKPQASNLKFLARLLDLPLSFN